MSAAPETTNPPAATATAVSTPDQIAAFTCGVADFGGTPADAAHAVVRVVASLAQAFAAVSQVAGIADETREDEGRRLRREYRWRPDSPGDHARYARWMIGEGDSDEAAVAAAGLAATVPER